MYLFLEFFEMMFLRILFGFRVAFGVPGAPLSDILWNVYAFALKLGTSNFERQYLFLLYFRVPGPPGRASETK